MKLLKPYFLLFLFGCLAISCSDDDDGSGGPSDPFVVAFEELSQNLINIDGQATVNLTYSEETTTAGSITINFNGTNAEYGTDFTTTPAAGGSKSIRIYKSSTSYRILLIILC